MPHDHQHQVPSDPALRVKALESALTELGLINTADLDAIVDWRAAKGWTRMS